MRLCALDPPRSLCAMILRRCSTCGRKGSSGGRGLTALSTSLRYVCNEVDLQNRTLVARRSDPMGLAMAALAKPMACRSWATVNGVGWGSHCGARCWG